MMLGLLGLGAWRGDMCAADSGGAYRVSTLAGGGPPGGNGIGAGAGFIEPGGIAVDRFGNVFVSDTDRDMGMGNTIRKITPDGVVTTLAGVFGRMGFQDGPAGSALFSVPEGLAVDAAGTLFVADSHNHVVRKISPDHLVTTLSGGLAYPLAVAVDRAGNVYIADTYQHVIRKITPQGERQIVAGVVYSAGSTDGVGMTAQFKSPSGIGLDAAGNIFVADGGHTIRKITSGGAVTTLAGAAGVSGTADGVGNAARFGSLSGLAVDHSGNIYVADTLSNTLRKITSSGVVSTVAGKPGVAGRADGIGSDARFYFPVGVAVDAVGTVYVADMGNDRVRVAVPLEAPTIQAQPTSQTIARGSTVVFSVKATSAPPMSYQWARNGETIRGATDSILVITPATQAEAGAYSCTVSNANGVTTSNEAVLTVVPTAGASRFVNFSVRATAGAEGQPLIVGFVVGGAGTTGAANVLVRAAGPALSAFGTSDVLADPTLSVLQAGVVIASNDNWGSPANNLAAVQAAERITGAFPFRSLVSLDAALVAELPASIHGYTAQIAGNSPGTTLVELYDGTIAAAPTAPRLINVSVRSHVGAAASELIAGIVISGTTSRTVLIRAMGPSLRQFGMNAALASPQLAVHSTVNSETLTVATDAHWAGQTPISAVARSVGAFPFASPTSADAAILRSLPPGAYTVNVSAPPGDSGLVLLELYEVP